MKCQDAWKVLVDVSSGLEVKASGGDAQELSSMGLLAPLKPNGDGSGAQSGAEMENLRNRLGQIATEREQLNAQLQQLGATDPMSSPTSLARKYPNYGADVKRLDDLDAEERSLRTKFIGLVQASIEKVRRATLNGEPVRLTFKGRETMTVLGQRMARASSMELGAFLAELDSIGGFFEQRAVRAKRILEILSPRFKQTDEIHIRLVSVGLSGRQGSPEEAAEMFTQVFQSLSAATYMDSPTAMLLSEVLTLRARDQAELGSLIQSARNMIATSWDDNPVNEDQIRAAAILLASGKEINTIEGLTREVHANYCPNSWSAAAVLASAEGMEQSMAPPTPDGYAEAGYNPSTRSDVVLQRHSELYRAIHQDYGDEVGDTMSAALMAASGLPIQVAVDRFGRAYQILERFNGGSMRVPSAMISILPNEVDEAMDNVRIASASIMRNKLSLGGAENLSLGIKMLVHSAAIAAGSGGGAPAMASGLSTPMVLALTGISVATAFAIGASLLAFHEFSLHKIAVQDYVWHPVHTHYVYG
jgi:hypothetical protein